MRLEIFDFAKLNLRLRWSSGSETEGLLSRVCSAGEKTDTAGRRAAGWQPFRHLLRKCHLPLHRGGFGVRQYRGLHRGGFGCGGVGPHIGEASECGNIGTCTGEASGAAASGLT